MNIALLRIFAIKFIFLFVDEEKTVCLVAPPLPGPLFIDAGVTMMNGKTFLALFLFSFAVACYRCDGDGVLDKSNKPNIVFLVVESTDGRTWQRGYQNGVLDDALPSIRTLESRGASFHRHYSNTPVCCVSLHTTFFYGFKADVFFSSKHSLHARRFGPDGMLTIFLIFTMVSRLEVRGITTKVCHPITPIVSTRC